MGRPWRWYDMKFNLPNCIGLLGLLLMIPGGLVFYFSRWLAWSAGYLHGKAIRFLEEL